VRNALTLFQRHAANRGRHRYKLSALAVASLILSISGPALAVDGCLALTPAKYSMAE
jgi:hypothetical protein